MGSDKLEKLVEKPIYTICQWIWLMDCKDCGDLASNILFKKYLQFLDWSLPDLLKGD